MCLLLVLCADEAADVSPNPLQDDQEGQQVEEQSDSLQKDGEKDNIEVDGGADKDRCTVLTLSDEGLSARLE